MADDEQLPPWNARPLAQRGEGVRQPFAPHVVQIGGRFIEDSDSDLRQQRQQRQPHRQRRAHLLAAGELFKERSEAPFRFNS